MRMRFDRNSGVGLETKRMYRLRHTNWDAVYARLSPRQFP
jgi:hypothetical protein